MDFTIGADPELFFMDPINHKMISVVGLIGGSKDTPLPIKNGCAIQEDNVAAEFCIPACSSVDEFLASINFALSDLKGRAQALKLDVAANTASASFTEDQLWTMEAQTFGCDPDYNAYTKQANPRPTATDPNLRSCGGHVHVGTKYDPVSVVKAMDLMLGVPSVLLDKDTQRRALYGKAGAFRYKPYGVEYRTLSNFWIWKNEYIEWVYHQVTNVLNFITNSGKIPESIETAVQHSINNNDKHTASKLILDYNIQMP